MWIARSLLRLTAFIVIKNSQKTETVVVNSTTYYHQNPWYRAVLYEGEEVYVLIPAPVDYKTNQLPDGYETVESEGKTYYYHEAAFYQDAPGGGYVVVDSPVGAEVSAIPEDSVLHEDESAEVAIYQYDRAYFSKGTGEGGKTVYRVEPQPPQEDVDEIPGEAVTFIADGEMYYYVNYSLYVEYEENGKTSFVNSEPEIGAQLDNLPEGCTTIEENGRTYYQFDMVFFEEVEDEDGMLLYEVVGSPDGA